MRNVNKLAQVTQDLFETKHIKLYNNAVKFLRDTKDLALLMRKLGYAILCVRSYADASFAMNVDYNSLLQYIVRLSAKYDNASILHYASYTSRSRAARSFLGPATYASPTPTISPPVQNATQRRYSFAIFHCRCTPTPRASSMSSLSALRHRKGA